MLLFRFSPSEGLFVLALPSQHARVECGVFLPAALAPVVEGAKESTSAVPCLVVTFPSLRAPAALGAFLAGPLHFLAPPFQSLPHHMSRLLVGLAALVFLSAPGAVPETRAAYPQRPPTEPFDLGRFRERVPFAEAFVAFEPKRFPEFPGVGFFRTATRGAGAEGLWLLGSVAWAQELVEDPVGAWSKRPLTAEATCGSRKAFRLEGGRFYRFAGPHDAQTLAVVAGGGSEACAVSNALAAEAP